MGKTLLRAVGGIFSILLTGLLFLSLNFYFHSDCRGPQSISLVSKHRSLVSEHRPHKFKILGLHHTGSKYLHRLLKNNFDPSMTPAEWTDTYSTHCGFWKHSWLTRVALHKLRQCESEGFIALALIRNPLTWLKALQRRNTYELRLNFSSPNWLLETCKFDMSYSYVVSAGLHLSTFQNIETIWNKWNKDYESLGNFAFQRHLLIRYEDLVRDPNSVLRKIAVLANLSDSLSEKSCTLGHALQTVGITPGWNKIYSALFSHVHPEHYSASELRQACSQLDIRLMRRHGYNDCDSLYGR